MAANIPTNHPCFNEEASKTYGRLHLPVAPKCNISCNYCNRKYDCTNECRPGVTSKVLTPAEALETVIKAKERMPYISTIGIAGPGDSLANPEATFETLELINSKFNNMNLCLSTNGLMLADYAKDLMKMNAKFITVTVNAIDPFVAGKVYRSVRYKGINYKDKEAGEVLTERQREGLEILTKLGATVKINTVYIPDVNVGQIIKVADFAKSLNVNLMNLTGLIPVEGTRFADLRAPSELEIDSARSVIGKSMNLMEHCHQCRSDACGTLDNQTTSSLEILNSFSSCDANPESVSLSEFPQIGCESSSSSDTHSVRKISVKEFAGVA
jgi:nitrogen fixation protein NifB